MSDIFKRVALAGEACTEKDFSLLGEFIQENNDLFWTEWAKRLHWDKPFESLHAPHQGQMKWFDKGKVNYYKTLFDHKPLEKECLVFYEKDGSRRSYTYGSLITQIQITVEILTQNNVKPGDTVMICVEDKETAALYGLACLCLGARFCHVFFRFPSGLIESFCEKIQPDCVVYEPACRRQSTGHPVFCQKPCSRKIILTGEVTPDEKTLFSGSYSVREGKPLPAEFDPYGWDGSAPTFLLLTSGTTSNPRVIVIGTGGMYASILLWYALMQPPQHQNGTSWVPLDFAWAPTFSVGLFAQLLFGHKLIIDKNPFQLTSARTHKILQEENVHSLFLSPAFLSSPQEVSPPYAVDRVILAGDKLTASAWSACQKIFDMKASKIILCYGQSECNCGLFYALPKAHDPAPQNTFLPLPGLDFKIKPSSSQEGTPDTGTLMIRNTLPSISLDFLKETSEYMNRWHDNFQYFATNDVVRDSNGLVELIGRADNLVKIKGRYVDIPLLDELAKNIDSVKDAKFLLIERKTKNLVLFIEADDSDKLRKCIEDKIVSQVGAYALPRHVLFLPRLPKTISGKTNLAELKTFFTENVNDE